ncbi:MAG: winged helix-turn-helix transcriptional regulator [Candidatus Heimdallarchaeota archaeon]|nr:winged helix-turn-helix transcriptional regulator [Candidatus Heimdallarchaeota archaeon]
MSEYVDTRNIVFEAIKNNPGIHFRALVELLERQVGVINYHIDGLEKEELIIAIKDRKKKLLFDHTWKDKLPNIIKIVSNLKKSVPRQILLILHKVPNNGGILMKELGQKLGMSSSSLHWHVKRLIEDDLIIPKRRGREVVLKLQISIENIEYIGREIYPSKWDTFLDEINERLLTKI